MQTKFLKALSVLILLCYPGFAAEPAARPLTRSEVVALIAGGALPENIVTAIKTQSLTSKSDPAYIAQVKRAGADAMVLKALAAGQAKTAGAAAESPESLEQLCKAAELKSAGNYTEAARALVAAIQTNSKNFAAAFVMGELFRQQEDWMRARLIYQQIIANDPDFPEAHTKLSYIHYRMGDGEGAIAEAKAALRRTPENAEAHKNMGLGLDTLRRFDAAILAYREALRLKPDYAAIHYNLGILYFNKGELDNSVLEYKKAVALEPGKADAHHNLANAFKKKGQLDEAIREYREAKRLDPNDFHARMGLAKALVNKDPNAAIAEFRELEKMFPRSVLCHLCFGQALLNNKNFPAAIEQFQKAVRLDPSETEAYVGLGSAYREQQNYDAAFSAFVEAERLDEDSIGAHRGLATLYFDKKDYDQAIAEWRLVTSLDARDATARYYLAQSLAANGETDGAITEYHEALKLNPHSATHLRIAELLEKKKDYVSALEQYRRAAETWPSRETHALHEAADGRFAAYITQLKSSGRTAEAAELEKRRAAASSAAAANIPMQWQASFDAGWAAWNASRLDEAEKAWKTALGLAEKLQPRDDRLTSSLLQLAALYGRQQRFADADANTRRALAMAEEIHGPGSAETIFPLMAIGKSFEQQQQPAQAEAYYLRALRVGEKYFGAQNFNVVMIWGTLGSLYFNQRQYDKAEPIYLRQLEIEEARVGKENIAIVSALERMGSFYVSSARYDKAELYYRRVLSLQEKQFGTNSSALSGTLTALANLKRNMGAAKDARQLEKRRDALISATAAKPR